MARFLGREAVYDAAQRWRRDCLIGDGSMLSREALWTKRHCEELITEFVRKPDLTPGTFEGKLKEQLKSVSPEATRLCAEMLWLTFLFRWNLTWETKVRQVSTIWAWSGRPLPGNQQMLGEPLEQGIGSAGTAFNTGLWRELAFVIVLTDTTCRYLSIL